MFHASKFKHDIINDHITLCSVILLFFFFFFSVMFKYNYYICLQYKCMYDIYDKCTKTTHHLTTTTGWHTLQNMYNIVDFKLLSNRLHQQPKLIPTITKNLNRNEIHLTHFIFRNVIWIHSYRSVYTAQSVSVYLCIVYSVDRGTVHQY